MSRVLADSPAGKKGRYDSSPSKGFVQVGDVTDIDCPDRTCDGKLINRQSSNGARFVTCTRGSKVDGKCNFSGNILFKDTRKISSTQDEAERLQRLCVSCLGEVHGAVSIGKPTGETTQKGGKVYRNIHALHKDCLGKKLVKNGATVLPAATVAPAALVGKLCVAHDPSNVAGDLKDGCTGVINDNDLVVKGFANSDPAKPLHLRCGKREWEKEVQAVIDEKKFFAASGSSPEDEAKTPSAILSAEFDDF